MEHISSSAGISSSSSSSNGGGASGGGAGGGGASGGGASGGGAGDSSTLTISNNIANTIKENLDSLLIKNDSNAHLIFSKECGIVTAKTTKKNMNEIEKYVNTINNIYSKQVSIVISIYEFVLNRNYNFGIDISGSLKNVSFKSSNLVKSILKATTNNQKLSATTDSSNKFIRYAKSYSYTQNLINNSEQNLIIQKSEDYIKTRSATTTTNTATTTSSNIVVSTVNDGIDMSVMPRIIGNKISMNINLKINSVNSLKEVTDGNGGSIFLPNQDKKDIPAQLIMSDGEQKLIGSYQSYEDTKTYDGVAPIEDFIIAGQSGKKFIKKEIFIVIGSKIIK